MNPTIVYNEILDIIGELTIDKGQPTSPAQAGTVRLTDTSKNWRANIFRGCVVRIVSGPGVGQRALITRNGSNYLDVSPPWKLGLGRSSMYVILQDTISSNIDMLMSRLTEQRISLLDKLTMITPAFIAEVGNIEEKLDRVQLPDDYWSISQETLTIPAAAADQALPDIVVGDFPVGAVSTKAILMFKYRKLLETSGVANALSGAQYIQIRDSAPGAWTNGIGFQDDQYTLDADAEEGGDVIIGAINVSAVVAGNGTYNVQWDEAVADGASLVFSGIQVGLRIRYSLGS